MIKSRRHLLEASVTIERRVEDASHCRHENREHQEVNDHQHRADEQALDSAKKHGSEPQTYAGQHENHRNEAEAEAADDFFSPGVAEELGGALHRGDGSEVLEGQHGNHEVTSQSPDYSDDAHDQTDEQAHALFERAQDDADRGSDERPLQNCALARPSEFEAVAESPRAAHQAAIGDADERDVEEHDHEIVHHVQSEHAEHKHRRLVRMELFAGSQG